jgi:hypothetical protein
LLGLDSVVVHLGRKSCANLQRAAAEVNHHAAVGYRVDAQALAAKPRGDVIDIGLRAAESFSHLNGRKPAMEIGRSRILLLLQKLLEGCLLLRRALQDQGQVLKHGFVRDPPLIVLWARPWWPLAMQNDTIRGVSRASRQIACLGWR